MRRLLKQDIALGALYRVGAIRGFNRSTLVRLIVDRCGMNAASAGLLADHWTTSEPYRTGGRASPYFRPRRIESAT